MRSLKAERMPRENPRVRSTRKPSRPVREAASSRGRRESSGDGVIARAKAAIGRYIDSFYNPVRRHSSLDFVSPAAYERRAA